MRKHTKGRVLPREFFTRSADLVAPELLGKILIHRIDGEILSGRIIETEAYLGRTDPASHAYSRKTPANAVLFETPGFTHVYFIYGMHYCINVSAHLPEEAGGVLIRALDPIDGIETMARLRGAPGRADRKFLTGGPGRVCQALGITRAAHNGIDVTSKASGIQIVDDGSTGSAIERSKRIGIRKAVDELLRFQIQPCAK